MTEDQIVQQAKQYARKHKNGFIEKFAGLNIYKPTSTPITIFMAGCPGAGKTEVSRGLVSQFHDKPVRIDADEIREDFAHYTGSNAHLFQYAASIVVDDLYRHCLKHNLNVIVDGTFAYGRAMDNIRASLERNRKVEIYFVHQEPRLAWRFTQAREFYEKRKILKGDFIETYVKAIENVNNAKKIFGDEVKLNLVVKGYDNNSLGFEVNILSLDGYFNTTYTVAVLESMLL